LLFLFFFIGFASKLGLSFATIRCLTRATLYGTESDKIGVADLLFTGLTDACRLLCKNGEWCIVETCLI
jgi:hypothetical protein